eukprot:m.86188 g.86188  ORF g.86188 m.86188 type:complete len:741 (-) comp8755_c0_seq7:255-2477(-)
MSARGRLDLPPIVKPKSSSSPPTSMQLLQQQQQMQQPLKSQSSYDTGEYLIPSARTSSTRRRIRSGRSTNPMSSNSNLVLIPVVQERQRQMEEKRRTKDTATRTAIVREMVASDNLLQRVLLDDSSLPFNDNHESEDAEEMLTLIVEEGKLLDKCTAEISKRVAPMSATDAHYITRLRRRYNTLLHQVPKAATLLHEENALITAINTHLSNALHEFHEEVAASRSLVETCKKRIKEIQSPMEKIQYDQPTDYTQTPTDIKHELHDLYELQRSRLIKDMEKLRGERDKWCESAFQLASAVAEKRHFETMKRLQLHQTTWNTSALRFCGQLTGDGNAVVIVVKEKLQEWKRLINIMQRKLTDDERQIKRQFKVINEGMEELINIVDTAREGNATVESTWDSCNDQFVIWRTILSEILDDSVTARWEDFQNREKECTALLLELTNEAKILFKCHKRVETKNTVKLRGLNEESIGFFSDISDRLSVTSDFVGNMMILRDGAEELHEKLSDLSPPSLEAIRGKLITWHVLVEMLIDFGSHDYNARPLISSAEEWELSLAMDTSAQAAQLTDQVGDATRKATGWFVNVQKLSCGIDHMTLVSLSDEGEETISSLSHSTKAVTTACGPMEALHAGRYKDLPSITYEMEQWSRVCRGMLSDLKEAKSEGTDLAQVFARNKEVTDVTVRQCYCHMKSSTQNKNNFFVYHACFFFLFSLIVMSNLFVSKRRIGMLMRDFGLQVWMKLATS